MFQQEVKVCLCTGSGRLVSVMHIKQFEWKYIQVLQCMCTCVDFMAEMDC